MSGERRLANPNDPRIECAISITQRNSARRLGTFNVELLVKYLGPLVQ